MQRISTKKPAVESARIVAGVDILYIRPKLKSELRLTDTETDLANLDERFRKLGIKKVKQHIHTNPKLFKAGLPDLSLILEVSFDPSLSPWGIVNSLAGDPHVEYAEPVYIFEAFEVPNDTNYGISQYFASLSAEQAWEYIKGECLTPIFIAIVDTGVNWKTS